MQWQTHELATCLGPLHVRVSGSGRPAVMWHSAYLDSVMFEGLVAALDSPRMFVLIDGPGHGRSEGPDRLFDLEECADAALAVLRALDLTNVDWVGSAWGGHIGAVLAARDGCALHSLVAFCSPMHALPAQSRGMLEFLVQAFRMGGPTDPIREGLINAMLDPRSRARNPALEHYIVRALDGPRREAMAWAIESVVLGRPSLEDRLPSIEVPTLFVTGDNPLWPRALAESHANLIPAADFVHLPGVRHLPPLEDPHACARMLDDWWKD